MSQGLKSTVISALINNRSRCQVQTRPALISCARRGGGWIRTLHPWSPQNTGNGSNRPDPIEPKALISP